MADKGIRKASFLQQNLPDINVDLEGYLVRYRIVSEDRNRTSHWSPIFLLQPEYTFISGNTDLGKSANHINVIWDPVRIEKDGNFIRNAAEYDIWIRWDKGDNGDWIYEDRVEGNSSIYIIPDTYFIDGIDQESKPNKATIEIFLKGTPITRDTDFLKVYTIGPETV